MTIREIGCCGAYCKTCRTSSSGINCRGCKLGYESGKRDINKARCKIKVCCFKERQLETCAECKAYPSCQLIHGFHDKSGYKYKKYKQSMDFIKKKGYADFLKAADNWKGPYGRIN